MTGQAPSARSTHGTLVAGIGNIFLRDDGFGSEVARTLAGSGPLGADVRVVDYGVRALHLAFDLLDGVDRLIMVDAVPRAEGEAAGEVRVIEVGPEDLGPQNAMVPDAHSMEPTTALRQLLRLGGTLPRTFVVGCTVADTSEGIGLSDAVAAAVPGAAGAVRRLVAGDNAVPADKV